LISNKIYVRVRITTHPNFYGTADMFNVIVDSEILGVRERAKMGNFDSMVALGTYIQKGISTRKNPCLALSIFDYVIARKNEISLSSTYWNALNQKMRIHWERGEDEIIEKLALEMVRHMAQFDPKEWDYQKMIGYIQWLENKQHNETNALV
jgi:hypothetical protein